MDHSGGAAQDDEGAYEKDSEFLAAVEETFGEEPVVLRGTLENTRAARRNFAKSLRSLVSKHRFAANEPLNLVAHSHGGNAVKEYTQLEGV